MLYDLLRWLFDSFDKGSAVTLYLIYLILARVIKRYREQRASDRPTPPPVAPPKREPQTKVQRDTRTATTVPAAVPELTGTAQTISLVKEPVQPAVIPPKPYARRRERAVTPHDMRARRAILLGVIFDPPPARTYLTQRGLPTPQTKKLSPGFKQSTI